MHDNSAITHCLCVRFITAAVSVFKLMSVDGVSTIKCAVEHQLLV